MLCATQTLFPVHFGAKSNYFRSASISFLSLSSTGVDLDQRATGMPSLFTMNFSKFHAISLRFTGSHKIDPFFFMICIAPAPTGIGSFPFRNVNKGASLAPLTSHFAKMGNLHLNPFPGRTCARVLTISLFFSLVWCPNWFEKKPRHVNPSFSSSIKAFMPFRSRTVTPQRVAVLTISKTWPLKSARLFMVPSTSGIEKS
mmetsp:Transcript_23907/g.46867  ORF Transcript_23907/g.46867 Transcript_23907/m.46867 type:complete len:200 (-) Transcript_23907:129-728(-)